MKTILVLCIFLIRQKNQLLAFEPSKFDYCKITCDEEKHTACKCEETKAKNELITDDINNFRIQMVALHNEFRNRIASGEEEGCPTAADMNLLNYDLELEYISRCHAKKAAEEHDKCRRKHDQDINAGQNIFGKGPEKAAPANYNKTYREALQSWYDEIKNVGDGKEAMIKSFQGDESAGHFTQLVWAEMTHVGCSMAWIPTNKVMKNMILCNYAGKDGGGNMVGNPVYISGDPCSQCPDDSPCDEKGKFPALCGKQGEVPMEDVPKEHVTKKHTTEEEDPKEVSTAYYPTDAFRSNGHQNYVKVTIGQVIVLFLCTLCNDLVTYVFK